MKLTKNEAENLLDALEEWNDAVGPKELEDNEVGLNAERYDKLKNKLGQSCGSKQMAMEDLVLGVVIEQIAESIYQYSSCLDEMQTNTAHLLQTIEAEVRLAEDEKINSRRIKT